MGTKIALKGIKYLKEGIELNTCKIYSLKLTLYIRIVKAITKKVPKIAQYNHSNLVKR